MALFLTLFFNRFLTELSAWRRRWEQKLSFWKRNGAFVSFFFVIFGKQLENYTWKQFKIAPWSSFALVGWIKRNIFLFLLTPFHYLRLQLHLLIKFVILFENHCTRNLPAVHPTNISPIWIYLVSNSWGLFLEHLI